MEEKPPGEDPFCPDNGKMGGKKQWITTFIKSLIESFTDLQINLNDRCSYYDEIRDEIAAKAGGNNMNQVQEENKNNFEEQNNNNAQSA